MRNVRTSFLLFLSNLILSKGRSNRTTIGCFAPTCHIHPVWFSNKTGSATFPSKVGEFKSNLQTRTAPCDAVM